MMFATLDDLEASIEMIVFGKALAASEEALAPDSIVVVRGRVDHKDRETTSIVAQQIDRFDPTPDEVRQAAEQASKPTLAPSALRLRLDATALPATVLGELKDVLAGFPGESDVVIEFATSVGHRRLKLGPGFRVERTAGLHAELDALLGAAMVGPEAAASESAGAVSAA
jgi:DNA polymerase-3 subunit alpha